MFDLVAQQYEIFFTWKNAMFWGRAMLTTLFMAFLGCAIGFVLAFLLVYLRTWPARILLPIRLVIVSYVEVFRRIPFLVLIFIVLFGSRGLGLELSLFAVACVTIVVMSTAYIAEIIRAGFESIHRNQWESAEVMNFGRFRVIVDVIVPQAWPVIIPPAFSYFVMFIKETSLASQVGVLELVQTAKYFNNIGISALLAFGTCLGLYFALSFPLTLLGRKIEAKLKARGRRGEAADAVMFERIQMISKAA